MIVPLAVLVAALSQTPAQVNYIDMIVGKGEPAQAGDIVAFDYRGTLTDGTEFVSTKDAPPIAFELGKKLDIQGMQHAIVGMKPGGKRVVSVPPELGFGDKANGPIPPNSTLIFEVALLRVDKSGSEPTIEIVELAEGAGEPAKEGDDLEVHYVVTYLNGTKLDSSRDAGKTFNVSLGKSRVIQGFTQGLTGMKEGGKRKVTIPYRLAYGEAGRPPGVPPFSTLVFELEIVKIAR